MLLVEKIFKFHARVQKCHFGMIEKLPGSTKSRIYAVKSTKRGFSKKALTGINFFFLFYVPMNPSKAWNIKLEAASFFTLKPIQPVCVKLDSKFKEKEWLKCTLVGKYIECTLCFIAFRKDMWSKLVVFSKKSLISEGRCTILKDYFYHNICTVHSFVLKIGQNRCILVWFRAWQLIGHLLSHFRDFQ